MGMKFNINDFIKVKLTEHGKSILDKYVSEQLEKVSYLHLPRDYTPYPTDCTGYIKFTLWEFMNIFGSYFWNGSIPVIEHNEIIFIKEY